MDTVTFRAITLYVSFHFLWKFDLPLGINVDGTCVIAWKLPLVKVFFRAYDGADFTSHLFEMVVRMAVGRLHIARMFAQYHVFS